MTCRICGQEIRTDERTLSDPEDYADTGALVHELCLELADAEETDDMSGHSIHWTSVQPEEAPREYEKYWRNAPTIAREQRERDAENWTRMLADWRARRDPRADADAERALREEYPEDARCPNSPPRLGF